MSGTDILNIPPGSKTSSHLLRIGTISSCPKCSNTWQAYISFAELFGNFFKIVMLSKTSVAVVSTISTLHHPFADTCPQPKCKE